MSGHWSFIHKVLCRFKKNYHKSMLKSKHRFHYWDEKCSHLYFFAIFVINILMLGKERTVLLSCLNRVWDAFGQ